jgi:orotidine-5'-phosphate decarboxylase
MRSNAASTWAFRSTSRATVSTILSGWPSGHHCSDAHSSNASASDSKLLRLRVGNRHGVAGTASSNRGSGLSSPRDTAASSDAPQTTVVNRNDRNISGSDKPGGDHQNRGDHGHEAENPDEKGDWLHNMLYLRVSAATIACGACPLFHQAILDGKRNDIGSTATAYAEGFLGRPPASPWGADALTVSPYLGEDSLDPFVQIAAERGAGVFVLVKTSNPGGGRFQDLVAENRPLYEHVAELVEQLAMRTLGQGGYGAVGSVVGATYPSQLAELRAQMPHSWFLVPGYGAQGAGAADVAGAFDQDGLGAIVNNSRGIIFRALAAGIPRSIRRCPLARRRRSGDPRDDRPIARRHASRSPDRFGSVDQSSKFHFMRRTTSFSRTISLRRENGI